MNRKLDTDQKVFFYEQEFYMLSNFSAFMVAVPNVFDADNGGSVLFPTAEHAYHWHKFPDHPLKRNAIRVASSAHLAYEMAQRWKPHVRDDWHTQRVPIMYSILRAKVEQHEYVHRKLMETGSRELVEDSWRDSFWGWGENCLGENTLGKLWMKIRKEYAK